MPNHPRTATDLENNTELHFLSTVAVHLCRFLNQNVGADNFDFKPLDNSKGLANDHFLFTCPALQLYLLHKLAAQYGVCVCP